MWICGTEDEPIRFEGFFMNTGVFFAMGCNFNEKKPQRFLEMFDDPH